MNCSDIERYVYVYLDGEFEERELREFEVHTAQCDPCRRRVASEELEGCLAPECEETLKYLCALFPDLEFVLSLCGS